jgi:hypothetical protein
LRPPVENVAIVRNGAAVYPLTNWKQTSDGKAISQYQLTTIEQDVDLSGGNHKAILSRWLMIAAEQLSSMSLPRCGYRLKRRDIPYHDRAFRQVKASS